MKLGVWARPLPSLVAAAGTLALVTACRPTEPVPAPAPQRLSALQALTLALPALRAKHPDLRVWSIGAQPNDGPAGDGLSRDWGVWIWSPSAASAGSGLPGVSLAYGFSRDGLRGPQARSSVQPGPPDIVPTGGAVPTDLLDSPQAVQLAEVARGTRGGAGAELLSIQLLGRQDGRLVWDVSWRWLGALVLDAHTGETLGWR